ncbi:DASS family sodium-coupled anion symporter [Sphingomicrobium lutaoense]|uniref:DASS family divalent anion:Na+ symporter n=1 Tax=Sphingomicrobium lutaoense TaxID=515949 RepID=A0A839YVC3_9SPHN|nr:DASS family sodium-coupled anion symporter [Sphingomicrobium lutaoense]MBB3763159.1 DASS family divalent anion:Na+ symporter [Sphingomicrobium lutaoense]
MGDQLTMKARWARLAPCLVLGIVLLMIPAPEGVEPRGWHVLAVFAATILALLLRPFAMSTNVLVGIMVLVLTQSLGEGSKASLETALLGFANTTVWLVVAAFLIAGSVIRSGLGRRIALGLVHRLGKSETGLAYGIGAAELVLAPVIPSNTARGGGILAPIVDALCRSIGEGRDPADSARVSRYLVFCGAHFNLITAAMFLTGMAANPLVAEAAGDVAGIRFGWAQWALGAAVPGLISLLLLPQLVRRVVRPPQMDVGAARARAGEELAAMGPKGRNEKILIAVLIGMVGLWASTPLHGLHTTVVALSGIAVLLLSGAERWKAMASTWGAWDALIWLGGLVMMADQLRTTGVIDWFAGGAGDAVSGYAPLAVAIGLALVYFYSMYGFSMLTGHITAMVGAFLAVAVAAGAPPLLMVAMLAYFSNLCGCLTHYSTGPVVIYFGLGYHSVGDWFRMGFIVSLFHMAVWLGIGLGWWKLLGWW